MTDVYLGIDLGTSSVKVVACDLSGNTYKSKASYKENTPDAWREAIAEALRELSKESINVKAVGLSSQVGTYVINGKYVMSWSDPYGKEETDEILKKYSSDTFIREIGMPHPATCSFPIPRLIYILKKYSDVRYVCQPKELICEMLTGNIVSDHYSWRGLCNVEKGSYSKYFLDEIGIDGKILPPLAKPTSLAGYVNEKAADATSLSVGTPVYVGMNDFYSGLCGMGLKIGDAFDITGTSEHLGVIEDSLRPCTVLTSSPFIDGFVHYGVTAGSGASQKLGLSLTDVACDTDKCIANKAPVFLPYLNGERAPLFDPDAKGVYFGITSATTKEELKYAAFEGVAFSLAHIADKLGMNATEKGGTLLVSGGAADDAVMNRLKATLLCRNVYVLEERDTSALGAVMTAAVGAGVFGDHTEAAKKFCRTRLSATPDKVLYELLKSRYSVYLSLYPALRESYKFFKEV